MKGLFNFDSSVSTVNNKSQNFSMGEHPFSENIWVRVKLWGHSLFLQRINLWKDKSKGIIRSRDLLSVDLFGFFLLIIRLG